MSNIDWSSIVCSAEQARHIHQATIKADCASRISALLDQNTLLNIQGAALAGQLTAQQTTAFHMAQAWISQTLAASRAACSSGDAPDWPEATAEIQTLASQF